MTLNRALYRFGGAPITHAFDITPDDNNDLPEVTRAIYVGTGGAISVILYDDSAAVLFAAVPTGSILPVAAKRVRLTGTTALLMVGLA